jgi:hypothetical protein
MGVAMPGIFLLKHQSLSNIEAYRFMFLHSLADLSCQLGHETMA